MYACMAITASGRLLVLFFPSQIWIYNKYLYEIIISFQNNEEMEKKNPHTIILEAQNYQTFHIIQYIFQYFILEF